VKYEIRIPLKFFRRRSMYFHFVYSKSSLVLMQKIPFLTKLSTLLSK